MIAGRCVPDDINPCSLNLCEQRCSVYFGRVVCTCFSGYKFNKEKHLAASAEGTDSSGPVQACEDTDECLVNNGDCDQVCPFTYFTSILNKITCYWCIFINHFFKLYVNTDVVGLF